MTTRNIICMILWLLALALFTMPIGSVQPVMAAETSSFEGHGKAAEGKTVVLTGEQITANGITIVEAGPGSITTQLTLPGEIRLNADRVAHVVPRVAGVVREVFKNVGDEVKSGEIMAVLDSRELATLKAAYLAAKEREELARSTFDREKGLWEKKISAEQDYLAAKQGLAEASIASRSAEQQLHAIGCTDDYVKRLASQDHISYTRYTIEGPFDGMVIEKHITLGESLKDDASCFTIADLHTVWVDLNVYQKDIPAITKGQDVLVSAGENTQNGVHGHVEYIGPLMGEDTRTALARVVLPNDDGRWRPGQFVTGTVASDPRHVAVLVPKTSIQTLEKAPSIFLQTETGFEPLSVTLGSSDETSVEIVSGLLPGQRYAATGSFILKAMLEKGELHDEH